MVCTEPLPKLLVPTIKARFCSFRAPATISEAEALPSLINTTMGILVFIIRAGGGKKRPGSVAVASFGVNDKEAGFEKLIGDPHRLIQQAPRIIAQIQDQPVEGHQPLFHLI